MSYSSYSAINGDKTGDAIFENNIRLGTDGRLAVSGSVDTSSNNITYYVMGQDVTFFVFVEPEDDSNGKFGKYRIARMVNGTRTSGFATSKKTTFNRIGLEACILSLKSIGAEYRNKRVLIYVNSEYIAKSYTKKWVHTWQENNWRKANGEPAKNDDLWKELLKHTRGLDIQFRYSGLFEISEQ